MLENGENQTAANPSVTSTEEIIASNNLSRKRFTSKWDYTKAISRWHFDKWKDETDAFKVFMRVEGDWREEIENLKYKIKVGTRNYGFGGKDHDEIIEKDFLEWGYTEAMTQYDRTYDLPEKFMRIADQLKLLHADVRVHRQMPGMVAPIHVDTFCSHPAMDKDPSLNVDDLRRFVIQLTDWDWGHFWSFGNMPWQQWKAGDCVYFESRDVIHCTANAGKEPRVTMIVTGWMSEETKKLVNGPFTKIKLS